MLDEKVLVFVEVRYRAASSFVSAVRTVDRHKQRKLTRAAAFFLATHRAFQNHVCRFDVAGICHPDGEVQVEWLRDAFRPDA